MKIYEYSKKKPQHKQRVIVGTACYAELPAYYFADTDEFRSIETGRKIEGDFVVWCALPELEQAIISAMEKDSYETPVKKL